MFNRDRVALTGGGGVLDRDRSDRVALTGFNRGVNSRMANLPN